MLNLKGNKWNNHGRSEVSGGNTQILFILPPSHLSGEKRKNVNTQAVTHARVGSVMVGLGQGAQEVKRFMIIQDVRDASVEAQRELHALAGRGEL